MTNSLAKILYDNFKWSSNMLFLIFCHLQIGTELLVPNKNVILNSTGTF